MNRRATLASRKVTTVAEIQECDSEESSKKGAANEQLDQYLEQPHYQEQRKKQGQQQHQGNEHDQEHVLEILFQDPTPLTPDERAKLEKNPKLLL